MESPDPEHPAAPPILASDADRERIVVVLRDTVGEGRLNLEELSQRGGASASQKIDTTPSAPGPGSPKLIIETSGPGGTLQVRNRPPLCG